MYTYNLVVVQDKANWNYNKYHMTILKDGIIEFSDYSYSFAWLNEIAWDIAHIQMSYIPLDDGE